MNCRTFKNNPNYLGVKMSRLEEILKKVQQSHPECSAEEQKQICNELLAEEDEEVAHLSSD